MNSFRAVKLAIDFEIARQIQLLEAGGTIMQDARAGLRRAARPSRNTPRNLQRIIGIFLNPTCHRSFWIAVGFRRLSQACPRLPMPGQRATNGNSACSIRMLRSLLRHVHSSIYLKVPLPWCRAKVAGG